MFVLISLISWPKKTTFWIKLSWVMNHGAFSMIWKQNAKACNGKNQGHQTKKGTHVMSPSEDNAHLFF
jgi:hypothetical protein